MLAQNFKPADKLGLNERSLTALIRVLNLLEREELTKTPMDAPILNGFNMGRVMKKTDCGTVGCIYGWAKLEEPLFQWPQSDKLHDALYNLFCPPIGGVSYEDITTTEAASALRNYLTTGEPSWRDALAAR